jgi:hypothetical protein
MYRLIKTPFNDKLFESIDRLPDPDPLYAADSRRLAKRLALRKNGKCVVTYP